jgi:hypothetical protein
MSASETTGGERDFPDRGPAVFAVTTATSALATVFVVARMVSRIGIVRNMSADDYIIILAWLIAFFLSLTISFGTRFGLGRHDSNIEHVDKPGLRMCEYVFSILYVCQALLIHVLHSAVCLTRITEPCPHGNQDVYTRLLSPLG